MGWFGTALRTHLNSARVVLSMDPIMTMILGVIGEFPCFIGLKLMTADIILDAIGGRVRMRTARQLRVASTTMGSLDKLAGEMGEGGNVLRRVFLKDTQESVEQCRCFGLKVG